LEPILRKNQNNDANMSVCVHTSHENSSHFHEELSIRHWRVKYARYWITEHHSQRKSVVAEH